MSEPGKPPDFSNLTENLTQQQAKISALKELVRQSESQHGQKTASAQEKVKNIAQRLSNLKSKTSKSKHHRSTSEIVDFEISNIEEEESDSSVNTSAHSSRARSETPGSEKITLLRKQMELNRTRMAERESKSKEIEQMVTQLKSKFESSQMSLEKSVELGRSMGDLSSLTSAPQFRSVSDVSHSSHTFNIENERIKFLEKRIHELEETINDKDNMTESDKVQRLEGKILDLEENLREKESIIEARTKAVSLLSENLTKKKKDVVDSLEETKQEMFKMQETFLDTEVSYKDEVERLNRVIKDRSDEIQNLNEKCEILEKSRYDLTIENSELKTKLEDVQDYSTKISELNKLNETLQKQISNLESQRYEFITDDEVGGESVETRSELLEKIKSLMSENETLRENLQEKEVEVNVVNANFNVLQEKLNALGPKSLFPSDSPGDEEAQVEIAKLKQQLDDSNKNMIKTKLKVKQLEKQVNSFKKSSDSNQEVTRLTEEVQVLTQKIAELEESKDNKGSDWQEWGAETETAELEKKIKVLEATCQNQTSAIQLLEEQKMDMMEELDTAKQGLETARDNSELQLKFEELEEKLNEALQAKDELEAKLTRYIAENMELHEKIDKLSKGSSAESIEMVNLTAQENEEYQKALGGGQKDLGDVEISQELNESLRNLREESSELMSKIELFTIERREVLDKLDAVTIENQVLVSSIESIREEKVALEHENDSLKANQERIEKLLSELQTDKEELSGKVAELNEHRSKLQEEINKLVKEGLEASSPSQGSPTKSADSGESSTASAIDKDACEKLLKQLDTEIQNLNKNKDKHQKLKISKKLSDNAKNVHAMMTNLLVDYYKNLEEFQQLRGDFEKVKLLLSATSTSEDNEDVQKLQKQLKETEEKLGAKNEEIYELQAKLEELQNSQQDISLIEIETLKSQLEELTSEMKHKDEIAVKLQEMVEALTTERDHCEQEVQNQRTLVNDLRKEFDQLCADVKVNNQRLNEKSSELDQLQREFDMRLKTSSSEVEILKTLVAEQKQLLIDAYQEHELDINQKIKENNDYQNQVKQMEDELSALRQQNASNQESFTDDLAAEVAKLKALLEENNNLLDDHKDELLHKQETIDSLNNQIIDLYKTMEENSNKIVEKEDELQYLQEINDTNREEIRNLHQKVSDANKNISDLRRQLMEQTQENEFLNQKVPTKDPKTEQRIEDLEKVVKSLEAKNKEQLDKLKKFAANLKKKQAHCTELEEKLAGGGSSDAVDSSVVNELKAQIIHYEEQMNLIKVENSKVNSSLQKSSNDEIENKKQEIESLNQQLQESLARCDQMEESLFDYQSQMQKLETEKMKLLESANTLNEVTHELEAIKEERDELAAKLDATDKAEDKKKMDKLKAAVVQLKHKLADKKKEADDLIGEVEKLKASQETNVVKNEQVQELQKVLDETKSTYEHENNILRQQIADLEASIRLLDEDKQRKVSLEGQLETFEMINVQLRERIANLEESLASLESEKTSILREKLALAADLEEKVNEFACTEDAFVRRVNDLLKQDELIGKKLRETESDNFQLAETVKEMTAERNVLVQKLAALEAHFTSCAEKSGQQVANLESDNSQLRQQVQQLQGEIKKLLTTHEQVLAAKHSEIDEMEAELSAQLQKIESEKKTIQEALEKANDQIIDFQDEVVRLKDNTHTLEQLKADAERELSWLKLQSENYTQDQLEIEQLRMQLMQSETEAENLRSQNENLLENHNVEITILRQQIADLETMRSTVSQNQTDDQVMLQNENVRLKELLVERESEIQQKVIQLQMVSTFDAPIQAVQDPFANLMASPQSTAVNQPQDNEKLRQAEAEIEKLRETCTLANMELDVQAGKVQDLLHQNKILNEKVVEMQSSMDKLMKTNAELQASVERQKREIGSRFTDDDMAAAAAPTSTSMLFGDSPPQASSLFDDPFSLPPPREIVEEVIQPKKSYLCYETQTEEDWAAMQQESSSRIQQLQSQIQTMEQKFFEQAGQLEHQAQSIHGYMQRISELEASLQQQVVQQQVPAIAQFFDNPPASQLAALEIEDGWGWGAAEVSTSEPPPPPTSLLSPRSDMEVRLQEQRDLVERLESEKNSLNEELSNLRDNSKKMMKKLKEYQVKIKELETRTMRKSSSVESNDMDLVIQEELNAQIQKLEGRMKEILAEREKEQQERESLMKRVDVLAAANDRMMEMKERQDSQVEMYQLKIRDLNQKLVNLEEWGEDDKEEKPASPAKENQVELNKKLQELNDQIRDMQVDYDEIQALLEEEKNNNKLLEEKITRLSSAQHQDESIKDEEIERLSRLFNETSNQRDLLTQKINSKDQEICDLISKIDQLSNESSNIRTILDDLSTQIQLKTNENQELNQRLQNLASNNDELSRERQLFSDSMEDNYRQHASDVEQQLQSLHAELHYKNSQIHQLNDKVSELSLESDQTQSLIDAVKAKDEEMSTLRSKLQELENLLKAPAVSAAPESNDGNLQKINAELLQEKAQMEHELQVLNDQVLASLEFEDKMKSTVLELDAKNIEIQMLKASLESQVKSSEASDEIEKLRNENEAMKSSIDLLNAQWSQAVEARGNEIANSWKQHLEMREAEFEAALRSQSQTNVPAEQSTDETAAKMKSIMESQEVEIVSLKEQLAIRSAEYAALSAKVDPYHQISTSMNVSPIPPTDNDRVPRSELDLALYMLHQRDMRLEEMTMELVRLLDERDQLQLRLSNSIRQNEESRRKLVEPESSDVSKTTTPEKSAPAIAEDENLRLKLSELNTVRHVRDKAIQDEREQRFMDNITMLQRDVEHLPPEAAARIVASSSDQGQSPSSVLMNWIMGKKPES